MLVLVRIANKTRDRFPAWNTDASAGPALVSARQSVQPIATLL